MTGPEHYALAEKLMADTSEDIDVEDHAALMIIGHALLAIAAATANAAGAGLGNAEYAAWDRACGVDQASTR